MAEFYHDVRIQLVVQRTAEVVDGGAHDKGKHHLQDHGADLPVGIHLPGMIPLDPPLDHGTVQRIDGGHKQQRRQHPRACPQSTPHGAVHGAAGLLCRLTALLISSHEPYNKSVCRPDTHRRIDNLLQNLGDGSLYHALMSLEIPPQHPQNAIDENGGGQHLQHRGRRFRHQMPRTKKEE